MKKIYKIEGMHCASCAQTIEKSLKKNDNVKSATVNFATKKAYVEGDIDNRKIIETIEKAGDYKAKSEDEKEEFDGAIKTTTFIVKGLDNPHCAMTVEKAVKQAGAEKIDININSKKAKITYSGSKSKMIQAIKNAGYEVLGEEEGKTKEEDSDILEMNEAKNSGFICIRKKNLCFCYKVCPLSYI
jgi:Cu+-exporting ATPase